VLGLADAHVMQAEGFEGGLDLDGAHHHALGS
jgi:hypothetical protein